MNTPKGAVIVGYDGSADAELALSWADRYADDRKLALHVLLSATSAPHVPEVASQWHGANLERIEADARSRIEDLRTSEVSLDVVKSAPTEALIDASRHGDAVVVGARGHGVLSGVVMGSVSQHVARHAACPVIVTRQPNDPSSERVVVGVDGSGGSRQALEFAFDHADRTGGKIAAIHGWHRLSRSGGKASGYPMETFVDEVRAAERVLAESVAGLAERYPDVEVALEAIPVAPTRALADASQSAALVVVGSRGHGTFADLLLGSVGQSVLHHARCSVAVVR